VSLGGTGVPPVHGKQDASPFELALARKGDDFAVMGIALQAGPLRAPVRRRAPGPRRPHQRHPHLLANQTGNAISKMVVVAYEPAFGIIGDPAKPRPQDSPVRRPLHAVPRLHDAPQGLGGPGRGAKGELGFKRLMSSPRLPTPTPSTTRHRALMEKMALRSIVQTRYSMEWSADWRVLGRA